MGTLDLESPEFWDRGAVDKELRRVYDICSGCRRCLPLCPSFKVLFDRLDVDAVDGDVEKLPARDVKEVVDLCYQCKLCFNHCPYTPPHRWEVDFPRLMLRARAADARANGVSLQDRMLGNTELVGKLGRLAAPLSNWLNELAVHRAFMHAVAGIHKGRTLPKFHRQTFSQWFKSRDQRGGAGGRSSARNAKTADRASAAGLAAAVREGRTIVVPGPTCSYMLKQEYPWLDGGDDAKLVARNTRDLFEFLAALHAEGKLDTRFTQPVGAVTYHVPCHLRAQNIGHKSADVLRLIPGATVDVVEKCSAVDGTWGFKAQYHELSLKLAKPLFDAITRADATVTESDCPHAAIPIAQGPGRQPKHA